MLYGTFFKHKKLQAHATAMIAAAAMHAVITRLKSCF